MKRPEKKRNHISVFPNKMKKKESHPDAIGTMVDEEGKEYEIVMWKVEMSNGSHFLAGKVTPIEEAMNNRKNPPEKRENNFEELPF